MHPVSQEMGRSGKDSIEEPQEGPHGRKPRKPPRLLAGLTVHGVHASVSDLLCSLTTARGWASLSLGVLGALFVLTVLRQVVLRPCDQRLVAAKRVGI